MQNRYIVQQRNSVTLKWINIFEGDLSTAENEYNSRVLDPNNIKYKHVFSMVRAIIDGNVWRGSPPE